MTEQKAPAEVMGWGKIMLILVAVGLVTGFLVGGIGALLGWTKPFASTAAGAAMGVTAGILVGKRQALLKAQQAEKEPSD